MESVQPTGFLKSGPSGKVEAKWYDDGERLKVKVQKVKLPEQSVLEVFAGDLEIGSITLEGGRGKIDNEGESILPDLKAGQIIEVRYQGEALLRGELYVD